jgi:hypothetical protein
MCDIFFLVLCRPLVVQVDDRGDGTYLISFMPDSAGRYAMTVLVQSKPVHVSKLQDNIENL